MTRAKLGDKVRVHYRGFAEDDIPFGSSYGEEPVEFTIGENKIIPGIEKAVVGMEAGETKTVTISPEDGFGQYRKEMITSIDKSQISPDIEVKVGKTLIFRAPGGRSLSAVVTDVSDNQVKVDANHPFAGKELKIEIELLEVAT
jgi:peptidylprolyl isomerase